MTEVDAIQLKTDNPQQPKGKKARGRDMYRWGMDLDEELIIPLTIKEQHISNNGKDTKHSRQNEVSRRERLGNPRRK